MEQTGRLLEIIGFFVATFIAGIFLEKNVLGSWSIKIETVFNWLVKILSKIPLPSGEVQLISIVIKIPKKQHLDSLNIKLFGEFLLEQLIVALIPWMIISLFIGGLLHIRWVFWTGISIFSLFIIIFSYEIIRALHSKKTNMRKKRPASIEPKIEKPKKPLLLYILLKIVSYTIYPPVVISIWGVFSFLFILFTLILGLFRILQKFAQFLSREGTLRRWLIVTGAITIFIGLVLEYVSIR